MRITCLGAARTVTGSSYLVDMDDGSCFLVDCGLFQGSRQIEERNRKDKVYRPKELKAIFITHAHIDHSGLVPRLVRQGYRGPVYASAATCELLKILWLDSAHIQEMEAQWQTRKNKRQNGEEVEPLYETADSEAAIELLHPLELDQPQELLPGASFHLVTAGHILGATSLFLTLAGAKGPHKVGFSGDLGRLGQLIVPDPQALPQPDIVFMETTYGSRNHKSLGDSQAELMQVIHQAYEEKGKVIIPAFAVERTQDLIYTLAAAYRQGDFPADMPVFLDSPLAIRATEIFRRHPQFFDEQTQQLKEDGHTPLNFPNLEFTLSTEDSMAINRRSGPAVIISANGMCSAGRIKHHLKHNLWRPNTHVVIVGFQAQGTTGRLLVEGARSVKIFRENVAVKAQIHTIGGFSAHADQSELLAWLETIAHPGLHAYLVHGEEKSSLAFREVASARFPLVHFSLPRINESITLRRPGKAPHAAPARAPQPDQLAGRLRRMQETLARALANLEGAKDLDQAGAAQLERRLAAAERLLRDVAPEEAA